MRGFIMLAPMLLAAAPALAGSPTPMTGPACHFVYTDAIRTQLVEPIVRRIAGASADFYDTQKPAEFMQESNDLRLHPEREQPGKRITIVIDATRIVGGRSMLDADSILVLFDPCTQQVVSSEAFPAFPAVGACPTGANVPPGAWCTQDPEKTH